MITPKQAEARRNNGKLSHGPVTPEGQAVSTKNALKYGFYSAQATLPGEDPAAFAAFRARFIDDLRPVGPSEENLVEKIAGIYWRMRRVPAIEARIIESHMLLSTGEQSRKEAVRLVRYESIDPAEAEDPEACRQLLNLELEALAKANAPELAVGRAYIRDAEGPGLLGRLSRGEMLLDRKPVSLHARVAAAPRGTRRGRK